MATRRPVSSRARVNSNTNSMPPPPQPQRPKSVMSRPTSQRATDDLEQSTSTVGSSKLTKSGDSTDTHIQVILRCRGRSEREMQANSPSIVTIESAKTKELTIETTTPVSSLGLVTPIPTRTYPFDLVFGPEATQSMIYHDVVGPMLNEVMMGYNCTLFAYGQTGTGKTYTMQGDLCPTPMGNPSTHAGIIPRVLFRLFHELEKAHTDFVVKVSFIELYNEELRDLLATDFAAPTTLMQPMGMAAKDAKNGEGGLKIFDDTNKRGVLIQGLEEIAVKDSKDALTLLTKGSERRQIAATKFNDHSSRSHSVFSLTVHIKETDKMGDDLLKVGKLNLVDLAGSENIGRSGAENKRAREAGMINQSLLTLGRVINALVDKASHVPYRESKLTRLLQDSLGGRTKTCIIATISPARSNLEETLSTLDYALRAKSIKNKPELNQRMTRNSLLKEYVAEIDSLRADLLAAREKNGIWHSEEHWNQIIMTQELKETELSEAKKAVEIIENQMRNVRDEYDQSIAVLKCREEEIRVTKKQLEEAEHHLEQKEIELQRSTQAYEQEVVVRQAHQDTEQSLNSIATSLKKVVTQSLGDVDDLFEKLDRKQKVLSSNNDVASETEKLIRTFSQSFATKLAELSQLSSKNFSNLQSQTRIFQSTERQSLSKHIEMIDNQFNKARALFQHMADSGATEDNILCGLEREIETTAASFKSEVLTWGKTLQTSSDRLCNQHTASSTTQINILEESASLLHSLVEAISQHVCTYLNDQQRSVSETQSLSEAAFAQEMLHLKRQNEIMAQMLANERKQAEKAKADLLQRVSGMLGEFMQKRDDYLKETIGNLQQSNQEVEQILTSTYQRQATIFDDIATDNAQLKNQVIEIGEEGQQAQAATTDTINNARNAIQGGFVAVRDDVHNSIASHLRWADDEIDVLGQSSSTAFEEHTRVKRSRLDSSTALYTLIENQQASQQQSLSSTSKRMETYTQQTISWTAKQAEEAENFETAASSNLTGIEEALETLVGEGINNDTPSGSTPRKRKWRYEDEWSLTKPREELLKNWHGSAVEPSDNQAKPDDADPIRRTSHRTNQGIETTHKRSASSMSENAGPLEEFESTKPSVPKQITAPPTEPLIDSRKRNFGITRTSSRRLR